MKIIYFLVLLLSLTVVTSAQSYYSPYFRFATPSRSSGNNAQIGVGADLNINFGENLKLDSDISAVYEPKSYVGNGYSFRVQSEIGLKTISDVWVFGGVSSAVHTNTDYTKKQYQPLLSVHYIPKKEVDVYYTKLFTAYGNDNKVTGNRIGYRSYISDNDSANPLFFQVEVTRIAFLDAFLKRHTATYTTFGVGISFKTN